MEKTAPIYIAGHNGLVGSAIVRALQAAGHTSLIVRSRAELDLCDRQAVEAFFNTERPAYVFLAAAKVGGIGANAAYPADFIFQNLAIQNHVIDAAYRYGVKKLLFLGSSCIYPKLAEQPLKEEYLLTGALEPTNAPYAVAKIAGITMCQAYYRQYGLDSVCLMPTNLYGPGDNFDLANSHVLPALLRKIHEAKLQHKREVTVWGTGTAQREFLHVDDLAAAALFCMDKVGGAQVLNVGTGEDITIRQLAEMICDVVQWPASFIWDTTKPDGTPRKVLDVSKLSSLGWDAGISLREGVTHTYAWYKTQREKKVA